MILDANAPLYAASSRNPRLVVAEGWISPFVA
jgi:hypothetical protein